MQDFPHHYTVAAAAGVDGDVMLNSPRLPALASASPAEFGGPGDKWSPETMLVGAVADCFILTFRAIARASKLPWEGLTCEVMGTLDRVERVTSFTAFTVNASLQVPAGTDAERAKQLLEKAERSCLITNSLKAEVHLNASVDVSA
jgi:peroxiredoxin-like protein